MKNIIKRVFKKLLPRKYELPLRYFYYRLTGRMEAELIMLKNITKGQNVAIDIGANIGLYSYALSKIYRQVVSFEPMQEPLSVLEAYNRGNISTCNVALSDTEGSILIYTPIINGIVQYGHTSLSVPEGPNVKKEVEVKRLDDYGYKDVDFIKIDVEGNEIKVLEGALKTIKDNMPNILIEIEQRHLEKGRSIEDIFNKILDQGYSGFYLRDRKLAPISTFSYDKDQLQKLDVTHTDQYINNFIFMPAK